LKKFKRASVAKIFGISPSRLYYWEKIHLIKPKNFYTFKDLVSIKTILILRKKGISLQKIRYLLNQIEKKMPYLRFPLAELKFEVMGKKICISQGGVKFDPHGQIYLDFESETPEIKSVGDFLTAEDWFERGCRLSFTPETIHIAEEAYLQALNLDNTFVPAMVNLGNLYYLQGKNHQAAMWYELALKRDPESPEAHFNYASLLAEKDDFEEAISHYQMAIVLNPHFLEAHYNLALLYERIGNPINARPHWEAYLDMCPDEEEKKRIRAYLESKKTKNHE